MTASAIESRDKDVTAVVGPRASQILGTLPEHEAGIGLGTGPQMEMNAAWPMLSRLSVRLSARIPMDGFRVRDLLALSSGQTVVSVCPSTEDVPLLAGQLQIGWSEFEVVGRKMALRLTRLV